MRRKQDRMDDRIDELLRRLQPLPRELAGELAIIPIALATMVARARDEDPVDIAWAMDDPSIAAAPAGSKRFLVVARYRNGEELFAPYEVMVG